MRLNFVFFKIRPTSVWEIDSTYCSSTALSDSKRRLHWLYPSGGVEHASAVIFAFVFPSNRLGAPGLGFSLIADINPSSTYRRHVFDTVFCVMDNIDAIIVLLLFSLHKSKILHRLIFLALSVPLLTIDFNVFTSLAFNFIL